MPSRVQVEDLPPPAERTPLGPPDFDELYERWFDEVARWVRALGGPDADRDDLVQDVFLVAYRRLPDFDGQNPAGWLYRIARRRVRDFRRLAWVKHLVARRAPLSPGSTVARSNPAEDLETKERQRLLDRLLEGLSDEQRAAFVLFEIEGKSGDEIARIQQAPLNTVWARIYKARQKLKAQLARLEKIERGRLGA